MHWDIIMCLVSNERRENALDNETYSLIKSDKTGFLFIGTHCIVGRVAFDFIDFIVTLQSIYVGA